MVHLLVFYVVSRGYVFADLLMHDRMVLADIPLKTSA